MKIFPKFLSVLLLLILIFSFCFAEVGENVVQGQRDFLLVTFILIAIFSALFYLFCREKKIIMALVLPFLFVIESLISLFYCIITSPLGVFMGLVIVLLIYLIAQALGIKYGLHVSGGSSHEDSFGGGGFHGGGFGGGGANR